MICVKCKAPITPDDTFYVPAYDQRISQIAMATKLAMVHSQPCPKRAERRRRLRTSK